jgi:hypothetical protein
MIVDVIRFCHVCNDSKSIRDFCELVCKRCIRREKKRLYWHKPEVKLNTEMRIAKYKRDAKRRKKIFELTDKRAKMLLTSPCYYCGFINLSDRLNGIDRLDNKKDYTNHNCVPCCDSCNFGKGRKTEKEFVDMCMRVAKYQENI